MSDIKNIFIDRPSIYLSDNITAELDEQHKRLEADKTLVSGDSVLIDIDNITELPDGRIRFEIGTARFECFFHRGTQKRLYIHLNAARTSRNGKKRPLPQFSRWSWYTCTDCSWLCIEDPMKYIYDDLLVGWFYGNEYENYRLYTANIAQKIAEFLKIDKKDVIFYGSSSGGTAAIHTAALFNGGVAVSINGQVNFDYQHKDISQFLDNTGIDLHQKDKYRRNDICSVIAQSSDTKYLIINNCRSKWDTNDHLKYLCSKINFKPEYGLSNIDNFYFWLYDAKSNNTHAAFEDRNLFFAVDFLIKIIQSNDEIASYKNLFLLFNEFWYDLYNRKEADNDANVLNETVLLGDIKPYFSLEKQTEIRDIRIESKSDKYKNFCFSELKSNTVYFVAINGVTLSKAAKYTIGLFDFNKKVFLNKYTAKAGQNVNYCFKLEGDSSNKGICIFCGEHGNTQDKTMTIKQIMISYIK